MDHFLVGFEHSLPDGLGFLNRLIGFLYRFIRLPQTLLFWCINLLLWLLILFLNLTNLSKLFWYRVICWLHWSRFLYLDLFLNLSSFYLWFQLFRCFFFCCLFLINLTTWPMIIIFNLFIRYLFSLVNSLWNLISWLIIFWYADLFHNYISFFHSLFSLLFLYSFLISSIPCFLVWSLFTLFWCILLWINIGFLYRFLFNIVFWILMNFWTTLNIFIIPTRLLSFYFLLAWILMTNLFSRFFIVNLLFWFINRFGHCLVKIVVCSFRAVSMIFLIRFFFNFLISLRLIWIPGFWNFLLLIPFTVLIRTFLRFLCEIFSSLGGKRLFDLWDFFWGLIMDLFIFIRRTLFTFFLWRF